MPESADVEALFRLRLDEFTAARNALAAKLKAEGNAEEAERVRALPKPPISAWVVNQLYWQHRDAFDVLLSAGSRLRSAQASQLRGAGGDVREPLDARRAAMSDLTRRAGLILREAGHVESPALLRRVTTTLDALAAYAGHPASPRPGQLTADVEAPGFEALSTLIPRARGGRAAGSRPHVLPFRKQPPPQRKLPEADPGGRRHRHEEKMRRAAAERAMRAAERALQGARAEAARAESALRDAAARVKRAEQKKEHLAAMMEKAAAAADRAREQARRVAATAEEAAQAVADAERALEEAARMKG